MKSLTEKPAVLSVHEGAAGQYIVRVSDLKFRPLVVGVTKLLSDAQSFVVITPSDIKVFEAETPEQENLPLEEPEEIPEGADVEAPPQSEEPPKTRAVRRKKPDSIAGRDEQCGRCQGQGRIQMLMDGGGSTDTACPICSGSGQIKRYGARR